LQVKNIHTIHVTNDYMSYTITWKNQTKINIERRDELNTQNKKNNNNNTNKSIYGSIIWSLNIITGWSLMSTRAYIEKKKKKVNNEIENK
jgi:hypothetical protein